MKPTLDDLRAAFHEEADDTTYPDLGAMVAGARRRVVATHRRRLAAVVAATAAVLVFAGVVSTHSTQQAVLRPAGKGAVGTAASPSSGPTASPTSSPTASQPPSQSAGDARAHGIDQAVAALPIGVRVWPPPTELWPVATTQASTPEGLWLVSHPGAFEGADLAAHPQLNDYGELLLLTPDRRRILRAYPFLGVPPQWLLVTPQAVYCGRQGDGGLPDSMVCRVDRSTGALGVAVFSSPIDSVFGRSDGSCCEPKALAGRPGRWRLDGRHPEADLQHPPRIAAGGLLFDPDPNQAGAKQLRLDPVTLR